MILLHPLFDAGAAAAVPAVYTLGHLWRRFNLRWRWKAHRAKLSEVFDLLNELQINPSVVTFSTDEDHTGRIEFGSHSISWIGSRTRRRQEPVIYLTTRWEVPVLLFKRTMIIGNNVVNILVLNGNDDRYSYHRTFFGGHPPEVLRAGAVHSGANLIIAGYGTISRAVWNDILEKRQYIKLILLLNPKPVQADTRGELYKLWRRGGEEPVVLVKFKDMHINETYCHRVPPDMETAAEAVAWMFNKSPGDFNPSVES